MEESSSGRSDAISHFIGWCVLITSVGILPIIFAGAKLAQIRPEAAGMLAWLGLPTVVLSIVGGLALVLHRQVGAYLVYAATILMSFGSMRINYLPFANQLLDIGPYKGDFLLVINYVLVSLLAWDHWRALGEAEPRRAQVGRGFIVALLAISVGTAAYMRSRVEHLDGQAPQLAVVPYVGPLLVPLNSSIPVEYRSVYSNGTDFISLVFSGTTTEENLRAFASGHSLKEMGPEAASKFLGQARTWKLSERRFPRDFAANDLRFVGRMKGYPKVICQIAFAKETGRYSAHLMGILREGLAVKAGSDSP